MSTENERNELLLKILVVINLFTSLAKNMNMLKMSKKFGIMTMMIAKAFLETEEDVGSVTAGDKEDRIIKKTFNIVFRTYVPNPKFLVTSTGKIEEFNTEVKLP